MNASNENLIIYLFQREVCWYEGRQKIRFIGINIRERSDQKDFDNLEWKKEWI